MDLIRKDLDMFGDLQVRLELLDVVGRLVAGRQHAKWDLDVLGVGGVDHGGVALGGGAEGRVGCGGHDGDNLAAPAESNNAPGLDGGILLLDFLHQAGDLACGLWGGAGGCEEVPQGFAFLFVVWWVPVSMYRQLDRSGCSREKKRGGGLGEPGDVGGLAIKEIRHEDLVCMVLIRGGENIGSLERLREISEDVEYIKERPRGIGGAGDILGQIVSPVRDKE